jgi:NAD(P)-dependent dehydrogenase (short-subunit alcohol dehydrogenase family)
MAALTVSSTAPAASFRNPRSIFSTKGWNAVIDINLNGTRYMMQAAAKRWRDHKHPGSIVNIVVVTTGLPSFREAAISIGDQ